MLAFIEISINVAALAVIILASVSVGLLFNGAKIKKQKRAILKLEAEMLQNHAEILQLHKELSDKEGLQSKTPIFSIADNASEALKEQVAGGARLTKKVSGGGKSTS